MSKGKIEMNNFKFIGFSHAENYCENCGRKEFFNWNKPLSEPIKCKYCGGIMIDENTKRSLNKITETLKRGKIK